MVRSFFFLQSLEIPIPGMLVISNNYINDQMCIIIIIYLFILIQDLYSSNIGVLYYVLQNCLILEHVQKAWRRSASGYPHFKPSKNIRTWAHLAGQVWRNVKTMVESEHHLYVMALTSERFEESFCGQVKEFWVHLCGFL